MYFPEAPHGISNALNMSVILFNNIVEILNLSNKKRPFACKPPRLIKRVQSGLIRAALIDVNTKRSAVRKKGLPPSILADRVSAQKKEAQATQYYAILAFIPKIAIAIASGVAFLILGYLGFSAGADNSPQSLQGLIVLYASIPCLIKIIAAYLLWRLYKKEGRNYAQTERNSSHGTNDVS